MDNSGVGGYAGLGPFHSHHRSQVRAISAGIKAGNVDLGDESQWIVAYVWPKVTMKIAYAASAD
jgi:hypothetical protein